MKEMVVLLGCCLNNNYFLHFGNNYVRKKSWWIFDISKECCPFMNTYTEWYVEHCYNNEKESKIVFFRQERMNCGYQTL